MEFIAHNVYHVYNRGNYKQRIFYSHRNYIYFIEKIKKYVLPHCEILAWCLMPNHFHFLIAANEKTAIKNERYTPPRNVLCEAFRLLLSSYAKGINKQEGKNGNLFQQNTKSKCLSDENINLKLRNSIYLTNCFHYIHQNPFRAGLVEKIESWEYSSLNEYLNPGFDGLCNQLLASQLMDYHQSGLLEESYIVIHDM